MPDKFRLHNVGHEYPTCAGMTPFRKAEFSGCLLPLRFVVRHLFQPQPHRFPLHKINIAFKATAFADHAVISLLDVAVVLVAGGQSLAPACVGKFGVQVFQTAFGYGGMRFVLFDEQQDALEVAGEGGVLVGDGDVGFLVARVGTGSNAQRSFI